ncbi:glycosyltransferase family 2 protein [Lacinutrix gracilariae]|uniref:Glycosyltransferase family 2 protein n=1 Tax=Lacinutrix gracilariae TaxID=1747198 RepID=A0ABW5JZ54_9FLAO
MISKAQVVKLKTLIRHKWQCWYHNTFNATVKAQIKNPKEIPIVIISFNQLFYLKQLVAFLIKHEFTNLVIIDNNSTYQPLLDYLDTIEKQVKIYRLQENIGHLSFWKTESIFKKYSKGYYVVTDADIVPDANCPDDFMVTFRNLLDEAYTRTKVGFSLKVEDIPDTNPNKEKIKQWEAQFWKTKVKPNVFKAHIDTTFALYRPNYKYQRKGFTQGWRTDYPLQAKHGGWYIDINNLSEEQEYYIETANDSASWQLDKEGELKNPIHKKLYTND